MLNGQDSGGLQQYLTRPNIKPSWETAPLSPYLESWLAARLAIELMSFLLAVSIGAYMVIVIRTRRTSGPRIVMIVHLSCGRQHNRLLPCHRVVIEGRTESRSLDSPSSYLKTVSSIHSVQLQYKVFMASSLRC